MELTARDRDIIDGCKKGKRKQQDMLYEQYASLLLGVCIRYIGNRMEAEDVLHDAFIKIYINIKDFNHIENASFIGWLRRITVNTALNHIRNNTKHLFHKDINEEEIRALEEEQEEPYYNVDIKMIMNIIQEMPKGYSLVFNMFVFEKYSHQEIAESLNISVNTSKSQLLKARNFIKKKFNAVNNHCPIYNAI